MHSSDSNYKKILASLREHPGLGDNLEMGLMRKLSVASYVLSHTIMNKIKYLVPEAGKLT